MLAENNVQYLYDDFYNITHNFTAKDVVASIMASEQAEAYIQKLTKIARTEYPYFADNDETAREGVESRVADYLDYLCFDCYWRGDNTYYKLVLALAKRTGKELFAPDTNKIMQTFVQYDLSTNTEFMAIYNTSGLIAAVNDVVIDLSTEILASLGIDRIAWYDADYGITADMLLQLLLQNPKNRELLGFESEE
jgi:hypothetical protein